MKAEYLDEHRSIFSDYSIGDGVYLLSHVASGCAIGGGQDRVDTSGYLLSLIDERPELLADVITRFVEERIPGRPFIRMQDLATLVNPKDLLARINELEMDSSKDEGTRTAATLLRKGVEGQSEG